jgi:hypothetical protein
VILAPSIVEKERIYGGYVFSSPPPKANSEAQAIWKRASTQQAPFDGKPILKGSSKALNIVTGTNRKIASQRDRPAYAVIAECQGLSSKPDTELMRSCQNFLRHFRLR